MGIEDIPRVIRAADLIAEANKVRRTAELAANSGKAVRIKHPMKDEYFTFPPGTDPKYAEETVRKMLLAKARQGVEYIDMPSELSADRRAILADEQKKNADLQAKIKDLESRTTLEKVSVGLYYDDKADKYWRVTGAGRFEEAYPGKTGTDIAEVLGQEAIDSGKDLRPTTGREQTELDIMETAKREGLSAEQALGVLAQAFDAQPMKVVRRFEMEIRNAHDPGNKAKLIADLAAYKKLKKIDTTEIH